MSLRACKQKKKGKKSVGIAEFARESLFQLHKAVLAETNSKLTVGQQRQRTILLWPPHNKEHTALNNVNMCELAIVSRTTQLAPAPFMTRTQENMVTFFAKEKQNSRSYSSVAARVCRNAKPTDSPFKLLERETAMKKATAGPLKSQDLFNSAQRKEKDF